MNNGNSQTRKDEGLQALGQKTKYRDDYAPEVLRRSSTSIPGMIIG